MKQPPAKKKGEQQRSFSKIVKRTSLNFLSMAPLIMGIVGLVALFQTLVSPEQLASFFRGNTLIDTLIGTAGGSLPSGNPVISYILGGELLKQGVSMYAVTAFIMAWVTLGFAHLPAEVEVFGKHFVLYRNVLAFVFIMIIAVATTLTVQFLS